MASSSRAESRGNVAGSRRASRAGRGWTCLAAAEVLLATVVVLRDWLVPSLVLVALAVISLVLRRQGPASLGLRRAVHPGRLVGQMSAFAVGWTLLNIALIIPATNHLSGRRQDVSGFADLEGDLRLLALYLLAAWVVAAFCEEVAFRGHLLTRMTDVLGRGRLAVATSVTTSSLLFGLLHTEQGVVGVVASAVAGAVFCVLRRRFGTLWAPVLAHGFDDTIGFLWFYAFGPFYGLW